MFAFTRKPERQTAVRRRTQRLAAIGAVLAFAGGTLLRAQTGSPLLVLQTAASGPVQNSIGFGTVATGTSVNHTITLSNGGGGALTFSSMSVGGTNAADFAIAANSCTGAALASGQVCTVTVSFRPGAAGARTGRLNIGDNALGSPHQVPLGGFGVIAGAPQKAVGPIDYPHPNLAEVKKKTIQDHVQLPRLYLTWPTPAQFTPGDAELDVLSLLLAGGKNSRLYKRLVYDLQIAQDVAALQASKALNSEYQIVVTARPGASIEKIRGIVDEELRKIQQTPADEREFRRAINQVESSFYNRLERVGDFGGVGDQLNANYFAAGNPGYFNEDLARYRALSPADITAVAARFLPLDRRVELIVEPVK